MGTIKNRKLHIIHGWSYSTTAWEACRTELKRRGFESVMLHVPGLTEASDKVWTLDEYVEWLDSRLGEEKDITLVAHSNGGRIAIAYVAAHPDRIARLVLIDAAGVVHNEWPLRLRRVILGTIARWGKRITRSKIARKIFYTLIRAKDYGRAPENMRATMTNLLSVDLADKCALIKIPTFIIWGKKDTSTPVTDAFVMNENISHSRLFIIPDAGHSPHATHPAVVAQEITTWLEHQIHIA